MVPLLFPELRLASVEDPVVIMYTSTAGGTEEKLATCITGTVDYALFVTTKDKMSQSRST